MKFLTPMQMSVLVDIETKYNCNFYLPPFKNKIDCCFFDIDNIKNDAIAFRQFLVEVKKVKVKHKFLNIDGRKFMAVTR
jgi:hypothetical protein